MKIDLSIDPASLLPPGETLPLGNGRWKKPETKAEWEYLEGQMMNAVAQEGMEYSEGVKSNLAALIRAGHYTTHIKAEHNGKGEENLAEFNRCACVLGFKGAKNSAGMEKVVGAVCRKHPEAIKEMAREYQKWDLMVNVIEDNLPLGKLEMPTPLSPIGRASRVYAHVFKNHKPMSGAISINTWNEQMQEQIENPERYGPVNDDENPLGIEIGDVARFSNPVFGNGNRFVVGITAEDDGDFSIKAICPGAYGGSRSLAEIVSINGRPVSWSFTPKKKAHEFEAPRVNDVAGQIMLFSGGPQ